MVKPIGGRVCVTPLANACVCHERKRVQGGTESRQTFASRSGDAKRHPVSRAHAVRERRERSKHKAAPKVARLSQAARGMRSISPLAERTQCANAVVNDEPRNLLARVSRRRYSRAATRAFAR